MRIYKRTLQNSTLPILYCLLKQVVIILKGKGYQNACGPCGIFVFFSTSQSFLSYTSLSYLPYMGAFSA